MCCENIFFGQNIYLSNLPRMFDWTQNGGMNTNVMRIIEFHREAGEIQYVFTSKWTNDFLISCKVDWLRAVKNWAQICKINTIKVVCLVQYSIRKYQEDKVDFRNRKLKITTFGQSSIKRSCRFQNILREC